MAKNQALDAAYRLQKIIWRVVRPRTRGVKIMLFDEHRRLVLIRNSYGRSDLFVLPGGGVRWFEGPAKAAVREVREELGLAVADLRFISQHQNTAEGKRDRIYLFEGRVHHVPNIADWELVDARLASLADLPPTTSPATRRRIAEYQGRRLADGSW